MKALVLREFGSAAALSVEDRPVPVPANGEVLIDVKAAGVNFPDLLVIDGKYQILPPLPFSPGKECAGVVQDVGPGVRGVRAGQRVQAQVEYGAFAKQVTVRAENCYPIADTMSFTDAAALGLTYITAYLALIERAALKSGEVVLVTGAAGGVGLAAVQLAKAFGATVLAAVGSPDKAAVAKAFGADHIVDVSVADLRNGLREQVYAAVGNHGVDLIVENVGGDVFDACVRALAWCGRLVVVGFAGGRIPEIKAGHVLVKNISVIGLHSSDYRDREPDKLRAVQRELLELYRTHKIRPHVMASFPLERHAEALALVRDRKVIGKVVLTMD